VSELHAIAFTDGGTRGNPGPYGCAAVIYIGDEQYEATRFLGEHGTVNQAEYEGLILALQLAKKNGVTHLRVRCDSKLIVEQVIGAWRIKELTLQPLVDRARSLAAAFEQIEIKHVHRKENVAADALVTALLDAHTGNPRRERKPTSVS
jgi:ribonuclease HI